MFRLFAISNTSRNIIKAIPVYRFVMTEDEANFVVTDTRPSKHELEEEDSYYQLGVVRFSAFSSRRGLHWSYMEWSI
jgi:hypothetical protein